jgi:hypothetical protein
MRLLVMNKKKQIDIDHTQEGIGLGHQPAANKGTGIAVCELPLSCLQERLPQLEQVVSRERGT